MPKLLVCKLQVPLEPNEDGEYETVLIYNQSRSIYFEAWFGSIPPLHQRTLERRKVIYSTYRNKYGQFKLGRIRPDENW